MKIKLTSENLNINILFKIFLQLIHAHIKV